MAGPVNYEVKLENYEMNNIFALVIINKTFNVPFLRERLGADADKQKIIEFCSKAEFNMNDKNTLKANDLKAREMKDLVDEISQRDFSSYDAFVCFISSHGDAGGIYGVDGKFITVPYIVDKFKPQGEFRSLVGKPKLFFTQNCRGTDFDLGEQAQDDVKSDSPVTPVYIPTEADILVAYSSADGYESYISTKKGSWFMSVLMHVLDTRAHDMNLTDMLAIVNLEVAKMDSRGRKQMPCFTSSLRKAVYFKIPSPKKLPTAEESEEL